MEKKTLQQRQKLETRKRNKRAKASRKKNR